ncbi:hypothetical protein GCM10010399_92930 [Dactylosporangium fulvum]|uniref:Uncharacterized protein n=1 Tax=Dactylosporangium fulvum TaxID=53359 RepID=A0ABY5W9E2_9ACTN|nr:hypothetical protein [Dactylosporangium fulvum]UWP85834.1 hypothetical protein Dfulv_16940 [Dactylosporangium fulvum]
MTEYNPERLDELGKERARLRAELNRVNAELDAEIAKAHAAGVIQAEIVRRTGLTRESVAQKALPKANRWKRGAGDAT